MRTRSIVLVVIAVLAVASGCSATVDGRGRPAPVPDVAQVRNAGQLAQFLMPVPAGAERSDTEWGRNRTPTIDEFAAIAYASGSGIDGGDYLRDLGVRAVAHVAWNVPGGNAADVVLLLFDAADPARSWMTSEQSGISYVAVRRGKLRSIPTAVGYTFDKPAEGGAKDTRYFVVADRIGMMVDYFTDSGRDVVTADAETWLGAQYALLT